MESRDAYHSIMDEEMAEFTSEIPDIDLPLDQHSPQLLDPLDHDAMDISFYIDTSLDDLPLDLLEPPVNLVVAPDPVTDHPDWDSFNIDLPVEDVPSDVQEDLIDPLVDSLLEEVPVEYELITGGSRRGGDLLVDNQGFAYGKKRTTASSTTWICSVRGKNKCLASVRQQGDFFTRGPNPHTHPSDSGVTLRTKVRAHVSLFLMSSFCLPQLTYMNLNFTRKWSFL